MRKLADGWRVVLGGLAVAGCVAGVAAQAPPRIVRPVDSPEWRTLRGSLHPLARAERDRGRAAGAAVLRRMTMAFRLTEGQRSELAALLDELHDRSSPNYRRWLTAEEFAARFGVAQADLDRVTGWLERQGFTDIRPARSRAWVTFSGTVARAEAAFRTQIHRYALGGKTYYAAASEPSVPAALAEVVLGIGGLNRFPLRPRGVRRSRAVLRPNFTSEISGNHFLAPDDFATIYDLHRLYDMGIDGAGQRIAVVGQSAIELADIRAFRFLSGLPARDPQVILVPGEEDPGMVEGDVDEANLDVQWAGAVARNATIVYVYANHPDNDGNGVIGALAHAVEENVAPVLSMSYGICEGDLDQSGIAFFELVGQAANAQGMTIVVASGDSGAADCDGLVPAERGLAVDVPASLPYVTAVGGTRFDDSSGTYWSPTNNSNNGSALSYIPEVVWNDTPGANEELLASGGGHSAFFSRPAWQRGSGVPTDVDARFVPDISFSASPNHVGYLVCSRDFDTTTQQFTPTCENGFRRNDGTLTVFGGTSAGAPVFAGIVALINQYVNSPGEGNVNYILYELAQSFPAAFHDITAGHNRVPCRTSPPSPDCPTSGANAGLMGFDAGPGYDRATGLGSASAYNLVTAWTSVSFTRAATDGPAAADFQFSISPPRLTVPRGGSRTAQVKVSSLNGFSGAVSFTCTVGSELAGTTCSVSPSVAAPGNAVTLTIRVSASTTAVPGRLPSFIGVGVASGAGMAVALLLVVLSGKKFAAGRGRRPRGWGLAYSLVVACLAAGAIGCTNAGGDDPNGPDPPPAASVVVVQGTSGSIVHSATVDVTVE